MNVKLLLVALSLFSVLSLFSCSDDDDMDMSSGVTVPSQVTGAYQGTFADSDGNNIEGAVATLSSSSPYSISFSNGKEGITGISFTSDEAGESYGYTSGNIQIGINWDEDDEVWNIGITYPEGTFAGSK